APRRPCRRRALAARRFSARLRATFPEEIMSPSYVRTAAAAFIGLVVAACAAAQSGGGFQPQVGQAGKDVIWVPTPDDVVDRMLTMARVTPQDFVMDLGAGDGKIAIAAARKFGAQAVGIEYNPDMVKHANSNAQAAGVLGTGPGKATIRHGDIFQTDFSRATVITLYLLPSLNLKLRPQLLDMRPGTRIVSHSFTMEDWEPDEVSTLDGRRAYFWVVPAKVMGNWTLDISGQKLPLTLEQTFQKIKGTVSLGTVEAGLRDAQLDGGLIRFAYVGQDGIRRDLS